MTLVRLAAITIGLVAYIELLVPLWTDPTDAGGADIGSGLIAFALLAASGFVWALLDGRAVGYGWALLCWAVVSVVFSLGWHVEHSLSSSDGSISAREVFVGDVGLVPSMALLVLLPAVFGAVIGRRLRPH